MTVDSPNFDMKKDMKDLARSAEKAESKAELLENELADTKRRLDNATLACQAMWELLKEKMPFDDDALRAQMKEVELRNGSEDGRIGPQIIDCPECNKKGSTRRSTCMYCGAELPPSSHIYE